MNYTDFKNKTFSENPAVKAEYDQLGPQYEAIRAAIASRKSAGLTQKQLAEKMGTAQANISRFENGNANPSLDFLQKWLLAWARHFIFRLNNTTPRHPSLLGQMPGCAVLPYHSFTLGASGSVSVFAIVRALRFLDCESRCA